MTRHRAFWFPADAPATTVHRFDLVQSEIAGAADLAYVRGSFTLGFDYDGASYESAGTYLSILRRSYREHVRRLLDGITG